MSVTTCLLAVDRLGEFRWKNCSKFQLWNNYQPITHLSSPPFTKSCKFTSWIPPIWLENMFPASDDDSFCDIECPPPPRTSHETRLNWHPQEPPIWRSVQTSVYSLKARLELSENLIKFSSRARAWCWIPHGSRGYYHHAISAHHQIGRRTCRSSNRIGCERASWRGGNLRYSMMSALSSDLRFLIQFTWIICAGECSNIMGQKLN